MDTSGKPFLVIYVAWHPQMAGGQVLAKTLYNHYRRQLYDNITGGAGLNVLYRSTPAPGAALPADIDLGESATTAIVLLLDEQWCADPVWVAWAHELMERSNAAGLGTRVFPVAVACQALELGMAEQALRWDGWSDLPEPARKRQLLSGLTYQFCRMLRFYLERLKRPLEDEEGLLGYLRKVEIFLSHSKHDPNGVRIAKEIRQHLHQGNGFDTFFDVHDIPPGVRFHEVILKKVKVSAVVAIHTDSYSSREWCRREIIEAKRWNVPLVVANCISDLDERSFPYMGNVPVVRMDPTLADRIDDVVGRLLDEVLKDFLWRCRTQLVADAPPRDTVFLPRPPELISLAGLPKAPQVTLVYPDPPIGVEEQQLFKEIAPDVHLQSITEWTATLTA